MLNIDLMTEQEIINLLHNPENIKEIIEGTKIAFYQGEEHPLELWHLFARISPNNQDKDNQLDITKIGKLMSEKIQPGIKNTLKNDSKQNLEICHKVYAPLVNLINKLSIKQAKELVAVPSIRQLCINPKINTGITYTVLSWIDKPSVLKILSDYVDLKIEEIKNEKNNLKTIKTILRDMIKEHQDITGVKAYFETNNQSIQDKEKYLENNYNYYVSTKGMINHILSEIITKSEERQNERQVQKNIDYLNKLSHQEEQPQKSRR